MDYWIGINATLRRLYEYTHRPEDWQDFHQNLDTWEGEIKECIRTFNDSFTELRQASTFKPIIPVMGQVEYQYKITLSTPKSVVDPLGLYIKTTKHTEDAGVADSAKKEVVLSERYKPFFKLYADYKNALENFIRQSGKAVCDLIKNKSDASFTIEENNLRVSYVNLYDAIVKRPEYYVLKRKYFNKFYNSATEPLNDTILYSTATIWKSFWPAVQKGENNKIITRDKISALKADFENNLLKSFKAIHRNNTYTVKYINDSSSEYIPIIVFNASNPIDGLLALKLCYNAVRQCIAQTEYSSLKYLMLQRYFNKVSFITLVNGFTIENKLNEFSLYNLRDVDFENLPFFALIPIPIKNSILDSLHIGSWLSIYPKLQEMFDLVSDYSKLCFLVGHLADLKFFDNNESLEEKGVSIIQEHFKNIESSLMDSLNSISEKLSILSSELPSELDHFEDEAEQEYWQLLLEIMTNILPKHETELNESETEIKFNMSVLENWSSALQSTLPTWGMFIMHLQNRYLLHANVKT